jgi:hypothetical protein
VCQHVQLLESHQYFLTFYLPASPTCLLACLPAWLFAHPPAFLCLHADHADAERQDREVVAILSACVTHLRAHNLHAHLLAYLCLPVPADLADAERQDREVAYKEKALEYHLAQVKESDNV